MHEKSCISFPSAGPRLDNPRENVYNENTKGAARKRLAPYRTAYQKRLTVKYLGKHSWRSVFFAFMILVVVADFPRDVEDAMRYAANKSQQQQHFRQSHAHPSLRRSIGRIRSKKPPSRCLFTQVSKAVRFGKERFAAYVCGNTSGSSKTAV